MIALTANPVMAEMSLSKLIGIWKIERMLFFARAEMLADDVFSLQQMFLLRILLCFRISMWIVETIQLDDGCT